MQLIPPPKQSFMASFPRYEPAARDHTAVIHAKECLRKYFYRIVLGFAERETKPFFKFGTAYHVFMETLEKSWYDPLLKTGNKDHNDKEHLIKAIAASMKSFGRGDPPVGSRYDFLSSGRLLASCKMAYKKWQAEKKSGSIKVIGVEQAFEVLLKDGKTRRGGKADQFTEWNSQLAGKDFKTSSQTEDKFRRSIDPNEQFNGYLLGLSKLSGEHVSILFVDTLYNSKPTKTYSGGPKIVVYTVNKTRWQLEQYEEDVIFWEQSIINRAREEDKWPLNEKACWRCEYRSVCKKGTERAMMNQLESEFTVSPWDYKTLGEEKVV